MKIVYTKKYKKDLKKVSQYKHFNEEELNKIIQSLARGEKLDKKYKPHKMLNRMYKNSINFHFSADILVLYKIVEEELQLIGIGNHSNLLGNEDGNTHY